MALPSQGYMSSSARITSEIQQGFDDITEEIAKGYASYVSTRTYGKDYKALASNGIVYTSKSASNLNNTPQADDGSNWFANVYDNLLGEWSDLTGTVYKGAGIHYLGGLYQVVSDIADVTLSVPSDINIEYETVLDIPTIKNDITELSTANNARTKAALNAGGSAPIYASRAWCNFNGTGTPAIRASGNIDSITDFGSGLWGANLAVGIEDANGAAFASAAATLTADPANGTANVLPCVMASTTQVRVGNADTVGTADAAYISVMVMR